MYTTNSATEVRSGTEHNAALANARVRTQLYREARKHCVGLPEYLHTFSVVAVIDCTDGLQARSPPVPIVVHDRRTGGSPCTYVCIREPQYRYIGWRRSHKRSEFIHVAP